MTMPARPVMLAESLAEEWGRDRAHVVDQLEEVALVEGIRMLAAVVARLAARLGKPEAVRLAELIEARMR